MSNAPITDIDFNAAPYPVLKRTRANLAITFVPQLGTTLITPRNWKSA